MCGQNDLAEDCQDQTSHSPFSSPVNTQLRASPPLLEFWFDKYEDNAFSDMVHVIVFIPVLLVLHSSPDFLTYAQLTMLLQGLQNLKAELMTD